MITDVFTKYAFAVPTKNEKAVTVAKVLVDKVFSVFGIPERLLSDRGRNFESQVIEQMCKLLGIKKVFTCPYSPRSDAVCERFNRTLIDMLGTLVEDERANWSKYVTHMTNIYNSAVHSSTGFSPYELIFGRKSRLPIDQVLGTYPVENEYPSLRSWVEALKAQMEFTHRVAKEALDESHLRNKYRYDQTIHPIKLEPGDKVFVRNVGVRGMHKLAPSFLPEIYEVVREVDSNPRVYEVKSLKNPRKASRILHIDMLRKVNETVDRFRKALIPGYPGLGESGGKDIEQLFAGERGLRPCASNRDIEHKDKAKKNQPPRQRPYWLRSSAGKTVDDSPSDEEVLETEHLEQKRMPPIWVEPQFLKEKAEQAVPPEEIELPPSSDDSSDEAAVSVQEDEVSPDQSEAAVDDDQELGESLPLEEDPQEVDEQPAADAGEDVESAEDNIGGDRQPRQLPVTEQPKAQLGPVTRSRRAKIQSSELEGAAAAKPNPVPRRTGRALKKPSWLDDYVTSVLWSFGFSRPMGPVTDV